MQNRTLETASLLLGALAVFADLYATQPLLPLLSREFHVSAPAAGLTIATVVGSVAVGSGLFGPLSDVFGRKVVIVWSGAALTFATILCALAPSFRALLVFRALQGLAIPGISAVTIAYIGDHYPRQRVPGLVGLYIAFTGVGGLVGRVCAGLLGDQFSWRTPFFVYGAFTLLATLALAAALAPSPAVHPHRAGALLRAAYAHMARHLGDPRLLCAFTIGALILFAFVGTFTYLPYKLSAPPHSLSTAPISLLFLSYIAGILISPIAGHLSSRAAVHRLISLGLLAAAAGCLLTLSASLTVIAVGAVVLCLGMFTVQAIAPAYVNAAAPTAKGAAASLYQTFYYLGAVAGAELPGLAWERRAWPGVTSVCLGAIALALLTTGLLAWFDSRRAAADSEFVSEPTVSSP